jgi:hypothetical protein
VGLNLIILAYDSISNIINNNGTLVEYSHSKMFLRAFPRACRAKAVMKLKIDPGHPLTFKHDKLRKPVLNTCVTADVLSLEDSEAALMALIASPHTISTGFPLPQIVIMVNLPGKP